MLNINRSFLFHPIQDLVPSHPTNQDITRMEISRQSCTIEGSLLHKRYLYN